VRAPSSAAALFVCAIITGGLASAAAASDLAVSITARAVQPGEVVRVSIACGCDAVPAAAVFGREIPLAPSGQGRWQGLVGVDLDVMPGIYPLVVTVQGSLPHTTRLDVQPKQFRTRALRVANQFVDPSADEITRILQEAERLDRIFSVLTPPAWPRPFALPLRTTPSGNFGSRSVFNGVPRQPHAGVDFSSRAGTIVTAPAPGRVALAEDLFFTGRTVILDHGGGLYSLYAHLSSIDVRVDEAVRHGARLGRVGATGRATGPHLHWAIRLNGARVDPLSLIAATAKE
jgi:hypothetical protein